MLTADAAARLNELRPGRHYTAKHIARMCKAGKLNAAKKGRDYWIEPADLEAYAAAPRDKGGRPRKEERFVASKCDRCGKATPARQNGIGDIFTLPEGFGAPLTDQGDFCAACCAKYDRENWIEWFKQHRPEAL